MEVQKRIENGIEYRAMPVFECRAAEDPDQQKCVVQGYATTFNEPYTLYSYGDYTVREQIDPEAFKECDMTDVIMQYDHQGHVLARTRNNTLELSVDNKGLFISADLSGTEEGRRLYEEIKGGYTDRMSFGFVVAEATRTYTEDMEAGTEECMRTITKISKLYDVSAVSIPANDGTSISSRSVGEKLWKEIQAERVALEKRQKQKKLLKLLLEV